jgi:hypothetical protein
MYNKIFNSQKYAMLWQDIKSVEIVRMTLRKISDTLTTATGVDAYNKTFQLNDKGLRWYIENKLSKKLFVEVFEQLVIK